MKLKAVAQVAPNSNGIESPSRMQAPIQISTIEFMERYADSAEACRISFDEDGMSNPQWVTTYTDNPMDGRFIVE